LKAVEEGELARKKAEKNKAVKSTLGAKANQNHQM
jgi:hypothetical protein